MSPRAAARLETLGYENVHDYVAGKADWLANGLPLEGEEADAVRAGDLAHADISTCRMDEPLAAIQSRLKASEWDVCVVVGTDQLVLGLLHQEHIPANRAGTAEDAMEEGPTTFRPDTSPEALRDDLDRNDRDTVLVTTNRGQLFGAVTKADLVNVEKGAASL